VKRALLILGALCLFGAPRVNAQSLVDSFDSENGGTPTLNYFGFANFNVTNGSVDLIGNGFFDFFPGNGLYVDLDGSTGDAGVFTSNTLFAPGNYSLMFDLAGSQRGSTETVNVSFGSYSEVFTLASDMAFTTVARNATVGAGGSNLVFSNTGGDNIGGLLDNVIVRPSAVPEASSMALLLPGLAALGIFARRRKGASK
jgi:hypothetical protein